MGIKRAELNFTRDADNARLGLIVDLGQKETERLPEQRTAKIMGHDIPVFYDYKLDAFAQSLYIFPRQDRQRPIEVCMSEMPLDARVKLVIVTGLSGAGRTTTIRCLEDLGTKPLITCQFRLYRVVAPGMPGAKIAIGLIRAHVISRQKRFWTCWQSYLRTAGCR